MIGSIISLILIVSFASVYAELTRPFGYVELKTEPRYHKMTEEISTAINVHFGKQHIVTGRVNVISHLVYWAEGVSVESGDIVKGYSQVSAYEQTFMIERKSEQIFPIRIPYTPKKQERKGIRKFTGGYQLILQVEVITGSIADAMNAQLATGILNLPLRQKSMIKSVNWMTKLFKRKKLKGKKSLIDLPSDDHLWPRWKSDFHSNTENHAQLLERCESAVLVDGDEQCESEKNDEDGSDDSANLQPDHMVAPSVMTQATDVQPPESSTHAIGAQTDDLQEEQLDDLDTTEYDDDLNGKGDLDVDGQEDEGVETAGDDSNGESKSESAEEPDNGQVAPYEITNAHLIPDPIALFFWMFEQVNVDLSAILSSTLHAAVFQRQVEAARRSFHYSHTFASWGVFNDGPSRLDWVRDCLKILETQEGPLSCLKSWQSNIEWQDEVKNIPWNAFSASVVSSSTRLWKSITVTNKI